MTTTPPDQPAKASDWLQVLSFPVSPSVLGSKLSLKGGKPVVLLDAALGAESIASLLTALGTHNALNVYMVAHLPPLDPVLASYSDAQGLPFTISKIAFA